MQTVIVPQTSIDLTGKTISTFIVYKVAARLRELAEGEVLEVITDDFAAVENDISAWCRMSGNVVERVERAQTTSPTRSGRQHLGS